MLDEDGGSEGRKGISECFQERFECERANRPPALIQQFRYLGGSAMHAGRMRRKFALTEAGSQSMAPAANGQR